MSSNKLGPEGISVSSDPEINSTIKNKTRQGGILPPRKSAGVRLALASALGISGFAAINAVGTDAEGENIACVEMGFTPDTIRNHGLDSTGFSIAIKEACRPNFKEIQIELRDPNISVDGQFMSQQRDLPIKLKDKGNFEFITGEIRAKMDFPLEHYLEGETIRGIAGGAPFSSFKLVYNDGSERLIMAVPDLYVLDPSIPLISPKIRSDSVQTTSRVINVIDNDSSVEQSLKGVNGKQDFISLINQVYNVAPGQDPYHYLMATSDRMIWNAEQKKGSHPKGLAKSIKVDFQGTGQWQFDASGVFGSKGRLHQIIFLSEPVRSSTYLHERMHEWGAHLAPSRGLSTEGHWKVNTSIGGQLGGAVWVDNNDGTKTSLGTQTSKMSPLELYLAGLKGKNEVPVIEVAENTNQNFYWEGNKIVGPFRQVPIDEIIAIHGPRIPEFGKAPQDFPGGWVFATTNRRATPQEMTVREMIASRLSAIWNKATEGRSTSEFVTPKEPARILDAYNGRTMNSLGTRVKFEVKPEIKAVHFQLVPYNNDGPGVNVMIQDQQIIQSGVYSVRAPILGEGPYTMLPGMSYTWRVRTSEKLQPDIKKEEDWSGWAEDKFKTPTTSSEGITPVTYSQGQETNETTPTLVWADTNKGDFYFEVQLSADPGFNDDPKTATEALYWNLVHGGISEPLNSWTVPDQAPLQAGRTYHWRVRQRVQGDGNPIAWTEAKSFKTASNARPQTTEAPSDKTLSQRIDWDATQTDYWKSINNGAVTGEDQDFTYVENTPKPDVALKTSSGYTFIFQPQKKISSYKVEQPWDWIKSSKEASLPKQEQLTPAA